MPLHLLILQERLLVTLVFAELDLIELAAIRVILFLELNLVLVFGESALHLLKSLQLFQLSYILQLGLVHLILDLVVVEFFVCAELVLRLPITHYDSELLTVAGPDLV